jgi:hypothetical protein
MNQNSQFPNMSHKTLVTMVAAGTSAQKLYDLSSILSSNMSKGHKEIPNKRETAK